MGKVSSHPATVSFINPNFTVAGCKIFLGSHLRLRFIGLVGKIAIYGVLHLHVAFGMDESTLLLIFKFLRM